jgi:hypothetical protein
MYERNQYWKFCVKWQMLDTEKKIQVVSLFVNLCVQMAKRIIVTTICCSTLHNPTSLLIPKYMGFFKKW